MKKVIFLTCAAVIGFNQSLVAEDQEKLRLWFDGVRAYETQNPNEYLVQIEGDLAESLYGVMSFIGNVPEDSDGIRRGKKVWIYKDPTVKKKNSLYAPGAHIAMFHLLTIKHPDGIKNYYILPPTNESLKTRGPLVSESSSGKDVDFSMRPPGENGIPGKLIYSFDIMGAVSTLFHEGQPVVDYSNISIFINETGQAWIN